MRITQNHHAVEALLAGDSGLIQRMYTEVLPHVAKYILNNNGAPSDADEIFQEAMCQIIQRARTKGIQLRKGLKSYLYSTCRNLWRKEITRRSKETLIPAMLTSEAESDAREAKVLREQQWSLFEEKFEAMGPCSKALLQDYFLGMSSEEMINKYHYASHNTVSQRVFKCKKRLAVLIQNDIRFARLQQLPEASTAQHVY